MARSSGEHGLYPVRPGYLTRFHCLTVAVSAVMLNLTGIIFAIQFVTLLFIGAYADYGKWRPWVMIGEYSFGYVLSIANQ
jgi:hypothetical protein